MKRLEELARKLKYVNELKENFASDDVFYCEYPDPESQLDSTWNHLNEMQMALEVAAAYARNLMRDIEDMRYEAKIRRLDERDRLNPAKKL